MNAPSYHSFPSNLVAPPHAVAPAEVGAIVRNELSAYRAVAGIPLRTLVADGNYDYPSPLEWWKNNCALFPNVAKVARMVLCIPATSAPSERVFSHAGLTIAKKRASLSAENAAALVFLHDSWGVVDDMERAGKRGRIN